MREMMEEKELALAHLLLLGNKSDFKSSNSPGELWDELGLADLASEQYKRSSGGSGTVLLISATSGQGCRVFRLVGKCHNIKHVNLRLYKIKGVSV